MVVAFVNFDHPDKQVKKQSMRLVNEVLPELAPSVFRAISVSYGDINLT